MSAATVCSNEFSQLKGLVVETIDIFRNQQKELKLWHDAVNLEKLIIQEYLRRQNQVKEEIHGLWQFIFFGFSINLRSFVD
jgi:hypothetical protein